MYALSKKLFVVESVDLITVKKNTLSLFTCRNNAADDNNTGGGRVFIHNSLYCYELAFVLVALLLACSYLSCLNTDLAWLLFTNTIFGWL